MATAFEFARQIPTEPSFSPSSSALPIPSGFLMFRSKRMKGEAKNRLQDMFVSIKMSAAGVRRLALCAVSSGAMDAGSRARPWAAAASNSARSDRRRGCATLRLHRHRCRGGDGAAANGALPRRFLLRRAGVCPFQKATGVRVTSVTGFCLRTIFAGFPTTSESIFSARPSTLAVNLRVGQGCSRARWQGEVFSHE